MVNLCGQSFGEGGGIGCGQRNSAGSDVINCDQSSLVMFSILSPFLSFPVSNSALITELFFASRLLGCANVLNSRVGVDLVFSTASISLTVGLGEGLKRRK